VRLGEVSVVGPLPFEVVRRIVLQRGSPIRACYERALQQIPTLLGHVTSRFTIEADGSVADLTLVDSDLPDPTLVACVTGAYAADEFSFPQPEYGGRVNVAVTLEFSPP
jgi:hypothetical protein